MDINHNNYIIDIYNLAFASFRQILFQGHGFLCEFEGSPQLSVVDRKSVHGVKLSTLNMNRLCNMVLYLTDSGSLSPTKLESFDVEDLAGTILSEFERMASAYVPLSISYTSRLKNTDLIALNKTYFEFAVLNILYCCIKTKPQSRPKTIKVSISTTETNEYVVFHIYDRNKQFNPKELIKLAPSPTVLIDKSDTDAISNLIALSLRVAEKSAKDMNGKLSISSLKNSNRYDIYLPKSVELSEHTMNSPVRVVPDYELIFTILSDIMLDADLTLEKESGEGEFEEVARL